MNEYDKFDFIIIIVLALLVAFIIGFNILQLIDSKLSSVTINVPPSNCTIPPIYLNVDKDSNVKQIKLNDILTTNTNESILDGENNKEKFGNLSDYPLVYDDNRRHLISDIINSNTGNEIIEQKTIYSTQKDKNYNTVNDIPLLVAPDTNVPNKAGPNSKGYYAYKVKLIEDQNSPLAMLAKDNAKKINETVAKCSLADRTKIPQVNGTFDGYNAFVDLRTDSYANVTSIGKSMLSPYVSYPIPS